MTVKQPISGFLKFLFKTVTILSALCAAAPAANKRTAADIPKGPLAAGNCRMIINEINLYPAGQQQFIEWKRTCKTKPDKVFNVKMEVTEDKLRKSAYKVIIVDHRGYLVSVCHLQGEARTRSGDEVYYILGGKTHSNRDFKIEDCEIADNYEDFVGRGSLPIGDVAPIAIGLVYNSSPKVIKAIALDDADGKKLKVQIDYNLMKRLVENLQDLIVFASSAPHSECRFFEELYSSYNNERSGFFIIRDWADENIGTLSQSRCPSIEDDAAWLPFQYQYFVYAFVSPNSPNNCDKTVKLIVEENQPKRSIPREDFKLSGKGCVVRTEDKAMEDFGTITSQQAYNDWLSSAFREQPLGLTSRSSISDRLAARSDMGTECETEIVSDSPSPIPYTPTTSKEFETLLEAHKPMIWSNCERFQPMSLVLELQSQKNPQIYISDLQRADICFWFEWMEPTRTFRCRLCHSLLQQGIIMDRPGSSLVTLIMTTGQGYKDVPWAKTENSKILRNHIANPLHQIALTYFNSYDDGMRGEDLESEFLKKDGRFHSYIRSTENTIINVFHCVRLDIPFLKYDITVETADYFQVPLGSLYQNPTGYKTVLMFLSTKLHQDYVDLLRVEKPVLSIMIDTSTDIASMASLAIVFHTFHAQNKLNVKVYRLIHCASGETGESLFNLFIDALKEDQLTDYVKDATIGFSSDGGSNVKKFRRLLNNFVKNTIVTVHCMNHRLELALKKAWDQQKNLKELDELVNAIYGTFASRSPKKKLILEEAREEEGDRRFEVKRIIRTRWIASKARALNTIFEHWKAIVLALQEVEKDKSFKLDQRVKAKFLMAQMKDPTTIATLAYIADACEVISTLSLELQQRGTTIIGKREKREKIQEALSRMQSQNGPRLERLLLAAKCDSEDGTRESLEMTLDTFESQEVTLWGLQLNSVDDRDRLNNLTSHRAEYLQPVVDQIDAYFPEDVSDGFDVFDPTRWMLTQLNVYGNEELKTLNSALAWNYDEHLLIDAWNELKESVSSHQDFVKLRHSIPEDFWRYFLSDKTIRWSEITKTIISNILAVQSSSAEVERVYSMYTHTKTPQRYSLSVTTVEAILRVKFNGPKSLKEFNSMEFAQEFIRKHARSDDETITRQVESRKRKKSCLDELAPVEDVSESQEQFL